jgi:hypothetical protein
VSCYITGPSLATGPRGRGRLLGHQSRWQKADPLKCVASSWPRKESRLRFDSTRNCQDLASGSTNWNATIEEVVGSVEIWGRCCLGMKPQLGKNFYPPTQGPSWFPTNLEFVLYVKRYILLLFLWNERKSSYILILQQVDQYSLYTIRKIITNSL